MGKSHYQYKKRQKELVRQKKKAQKRQRKFDRSPLAAEEDTNQTDGEIMHHPS